MSVISSYAIVVSKTDFDLALLVATSFASPESSSMKFLLFEEQNLIFFVHIYPKHLIFLADRAELD